MQCKIIRPLINTVIWTWSKWNQMIFYLSVFVLYKFIFSSFPLLSCAFLSVVFILFNCLFSSLYITRLFLFLFYFINSPNCSFFCGQPVIIEFWLSLWWAQRSKFLQTQATFWREYLSTLIFCHPPPPIVTLFIHMQSKAKFFQEHVFVSFCSKTKTRTSKSQKKKKLWHNWFRSDWKCATFDCNRFNW